MTNVGDDVTNVIERIIKDDVDSLYPKNSKKDTENEAVTATLGVNTSGTGKDDGADLNGNSHTIDGSSKT